MADLNPTSGLITQNNSTESRITKHQDSITHHIRTVSSTHPTRSESLITHDIRVLSHITSGQYHKSHQDSFTHHDRTETHIKQNIKTISHIT